MQLFPMGKQCLDVIEGVGTLRMAGDLRHLPRRELAVDVFGERLAALREPLDLFRDVDGRIVLHVAQFLDAGFELRDGLLELEECRLHEVSILLGPDRASARGTRWPPSATVASPRRGAAWCGARPCVP